MLSFRPALLFSFFEAKKRNKKALKNFRPTSARKWPTLLLRHTPPRQFFALPTLVNAAKPRRFKKILKPVFDISSPQLFRMFRREAG
jgi:hypothetical protein